MLGGDWSPAGLCLIEPREPPSWPANWTECEPRFGCRKTAIAINRRDLARAVDSAPVSVARTAVDVEGLRDGYAASADRVAHSVLSVVEAEGTALPTVASAFGLNARTFQRRLADVGLGFSDLVDDFRYRRAIRALRETEILISELALELGYEHPPNFARAFKSRVGVSPSAYRRSLTEVGAAPTP
jgi:AraC-like DNA-binding protein